MDEKTRAGIELLLAEVTALRRRTLELEASMAEVRKGQQEKVDELEASMVEIRHRQAQVDEQLARFADLLEP